MGRGLLLSSLGMQDVLTCCQPGQTCSLPDRLSLKIDLTLVDAKDITYEHAAMLYTTTYTW